MRGQWQATKDRNTERSIKSLSGKDRGLVDGIARDNLVKAGWLAAIHDSVHLAGRFAAWTNRTWGALGPGVCG